MKRKRIMVCSLMLSAMLLIGCSNPVEPSETNSIKAPEMSEITSICKYATLECYYHNVAKSTKEAGKGLSHIGEKERKFWVEYSGVAKLGVDMSKGKMQVDGTNIIITIPKAEILSIKVDEKSISDPICNKDALINKNEIGAEKITEAVATAQNDITASIENDSSLLVNAQDRAKKLIENYINQLGELSGTQFTVTWKEAE